MIVKFFNLKENLKDNINFYLLYGSNSGLIEETTNNILKPNFSKIYLLMMKMKSFLMRMNSKVF